MQGDCATASLKVGSSRTHLQAALAQAVWQGDERVVQQLLEDGATPDSQDEESGWSSLHRAFYWGHFNVAALLLKTGAQLTAVDNQGRSPLDLLSAELKSHFSAATEGEVYSWGNGANYQLGSGAVGLQLVPVRLEALHRASIAAVAAAKFHSAAVTSSGQLYTWGFGRGGRLGHADSHIHSGQSAAILPQQVAFFARRQVVKVSAAKHHTAAVTSAGELFTWGGNRDGRLGYQSVDTQPTPRKIATFNRQRVVDVAVSNRHTVALLEGGSVYSWGSNLQGQLGYGTADSASNAIPRVVESLKGKAVTAVAAAKRHTLVLTAEGEVFTWGHQIVTPKRVQLAGSRDVARAYAQSASTGGWKVVFHNGQSEISRPEAVLIAAGAAHSSAVTRDGVVLAWRSIDPALRPQEVGGPLAGARVVAISAGKYRTAVVTDEGGVFMWEGWSKAAEAVPKRAINPLALAGTSPPEASPQEWEVSRGLKQAKPGKARALAFQLITPYRVEGLRRITAVAVGEKHSVALQSWCAAPVLCEDVRERTSAARPAQCQAAAGSAAHDPRLSPRGSEASALDDAECEAAAEASGPHGVKSDSYWDDLELAARQDASRPSSAERVRRRPGSGRREGSKSLQRLCERRVAESLVEPRTVLQVLEYADAAGAHALRLHCMEVALSNLDLVVLESRSQVEQLLPHMLAEMSLRWGARCPRAITAPVPSTGPPQSEASPRKAEQLPSARSGVASRTAKSFRDPREEAEAADRARQERTIKKKLQQIEALDKRSADAALDAQQQAKVALRPSLEAALEALQKHRPLPEVRRLLSMAPSPGAKSVPPSASPAEIQGRGRRRRSSESGAAGSPFLQEDASTAPSGSSAAGSGTSSATRFRSTPVHLVVDSALPESVPRVSGFAQSGNLSQSEGFLSRRGGRSHDDTLTAEAEQARDSAPFRGELQGPHVPSPDINEPGKGKGKLMKQSSQGSSSGRGPSNAGKKSAKRTGGLSMFLSGKLEAPEPVTPPPPPPVSAPKPPSWALQVQDAPSAMSLREILDQEAASSAPSPQRRPQRPSNDHTPRPAGLGQSAVKGPGMRQSPRPVPNPAHSQRCSDDGSASGGSSFAVSLGDLVKKSKPIAVARPAVEKERNGSGGPAWGAMPGGSPQPGTTRLQDIQAEQEHVRDTLSRSWGASGASPSSLRGVGLLSGNASWKIQSSAAGSSPGSQFPAGTSPGGSSRRFTAAQPQVQNKWYIKEEHEIVPLRCIQTEESAIKELSDLYGAKNVRIAGKGKSRGRNRSPPPPPRFGC